jgi:hypothetical protein
VVRFEAKALRSFSLCGSRKKGLPRKAIWKRTTTLLPGRSLAGGRFGEEWVAQARRFQGAFETLFYIYYYILEIIIMKKIIATIALVAFASSASAFFGGDDNQQGNDMYRRCSDTTFLHSPKPNVNEDKRSCTAKDFSFGRCHGYYDSSL